MRKILLLGFFVTILFLHSSTCQQFIDDKNDIFEWYYNLNQQNYNSNLPRVKRQSRRFGNNFDYDSNEDDDDEWYVFDEVEPQQQPQPRQQFQPQQPQFQPQPRPEDNSNGWFPRQQQQQQQGSFEQFRPNTIPTTSPRPQFPNSGLPRPPRCVENCSARTTSEYNPVCGTNGVTYNNLAKMNCAANCGISVQIRREGRCAPLLPPPP